MFLFSNIYIFDAMQLQPEENKMSEKMSEKEKALKKVILTMLKIAPIIAVEILVLMIFGGCA